MHAEVIRSRKVAIESRPGNRGTNMVEDFARPWLSGHAHRSRIGGQQTEENGKQGGLAGAISPEHSVYAARRNMKTYIPPHCLGTKRLCDVFERNFKAHTKSMSCATALIFSLRDGLRAGVVLPQ